MTRLKLPLLLLIFLLMTACAMPVVFEEEATPTATPERPAERTSLYETANANGESFSVVINQIELLDAPQNPDVQILAVLTDGSGQTAYVLFPSNQPGVPEDNFSLESYPLSINTDADRAGLWVLALRHSAYPGDRQNALLAAELAAGFDELYAPVMVSGSPVAEIVDGNQAALLEWFGEVEVLGELIQLLYVNEPVEAKVVASRDNGVRLTYTFQIGVIEGAQAATPLPTIDATDEAPNSGATADPAETEIAASPISFEGYRRVIDEDFEENTSDVTWFTIEADTYSMLYSGGGYAIDLISMSDDEESDGIQSWGSIQGLYFNNYIVRANIRFVQADAVGSTGLWLNYRTAYSFLSFAFNTDGEYRVGRFQDRYFELIPWTSGPALNPPGASNELIIRLENNTYSLTINGQPIPMVIDDPAAALRSGRIAFYCYAETVPATCLLEEIEVWIPEDAPYPVTSPFPDARPTGTP